MSSGVGEKEQPRKVQYIHTTGKIGKGSQAIYPYPPREIRDLTLSQTLGSFLSLPFSEVKVLLHRLKSAAKTIDRCGPLVVGSSLTLSLTRSYL